MIVYLARDIPAFVMYCINGASRSSLIIKSPDYDIYNITYLLLSGLLLLFLLSECSLNGLHTWREIWQLEDEEEKPGGGGVRRRRRKEGGEGGKARGGWRRDEGGG